MLLFLFLLNQAHAQITDASFFPSVKSINPGVSHLRRDGFVAVDMGKKINEKNHAVTQAGIQGGIQTDIELTKKTFFAAGRGNRYINAEVLFDQEDGIKEERINSTTRGKRTTKDDASSTYYGGIVDLRFFGVSYAGANYDYTNKFRVGNPPDLSARDEAKKLSYQNFKLGTVLKFAFFRLGGYVLNQKADGDFTYTYYDPTTGNKGTTEKFPVSSSAKGYGVGLGFTLPRMRSEVSFEKMYDTNLSISDDYPRDVVKPGDSARITFIGEAKVSIFSLGVRFRRIGGNYADLEDIISSNLLYESMGSDDTRDEVNFNFSFGNSKGFSPSAFYTQSETKTNEAEPIFGSGEKYKAVTKSKAYGVNISYRF